MKKKDEKSKVAKKIEEEILLDFEPKDDTDRFLKEYILG